MARRLAREAGVWTVVLGDFARAGDSLHLAARVYDVASGDRLSMARVDDRAGEDARPLFDQLAAKLLDLSGAPTERAGRAGAVHQPVARGLSRLPPGRGPAQPLGSGRRRARPRAARWRSTRPSGWPTTSSRSPAAGWWAPATRSPTGPSCGPPRTRQPAGARPHRHQRLSRLHRRRVRRGARAVPAAAGPDAATPTPGTAWARPGSTTPTGPNQAPAFTQAIRAFRRTPRPRSRLRAGLRPRQRMLGMAAEPKPDYALVATDSFALAADADGRSLVDSAALRRGGPPGPGRGRSRPRGAGSPPSRGRSGRMARW